MKQRTFIITVILTNITFIILLIHKRSAVTQLLYTKQRYEQEHNQLVQKQDTLKHELCYLQDRSTVKRYAQNYLHMKSLSIAQMKKCSQINE